MKMFSWIMAWSELLPIDVTSYFQVFREVFDSEALTSLTAESYLLWWVVLVYSGFYLLTKLNKHFFYLTIDAISLSSRNTFNAHRPVAAVVLLSWANDGTREKIFTIFVVIAVWGLVCNILFSVIEMLLSLANSYISGTLKEQAVAVLTGWFHPEIAAVRLVCTLFIYLVAFLLGYLLLIWQYIPFLSPTVTFIIAIYAISGLLLIKYKANWAYLSSFLCFYQYLVVIVCICLINWDWFLVYLSTLCPLSSALMMMEPNKISPPKVLDLDEMLPTNTTNGISVASSSASTYSSSSVGSNVVAPVIGVDYTDPRDNQSKIDLEGMAHWRGVDGQSYSSKEAIRVAIIAQGCQDVRDSQTQLALTQASPSSSPNVGLSDKSAIQQAVDWKLIYLSRQVLTYCYKAYGLKAGYAVSSVMMFCLLNRRMFTAVVRSATFMDTLFAQRGYIFRRNNVEAAMRSRFARFNIKINSWALKWKLPVGCNTSYQLMERLTYARYVMSWRNPKVMQPALQRLVRLRLGTTILGSQAFAFFSLLVHLNFIPGLK